MIDFTSHERFMRRAIDIAAVEVTQRTTFAQCRLIGGVLETEFDQLLRRAKDAREEGCHERI